jgi:serine/threonine protein phosphatase 1
MRINVLPIVGDHDYRAVRLLKALNNMLNDGVRPDQETIGEMAAWMEDGGAKVMEDFKALDADMREGVLEYLADMALYEEIQVGKEKYILVHAGIAGFKAGIDLEKLKPEAFFTESLDLTKKYFDDKIVVVGHNPTTEENGGNGKIFFGNGSIAIDCGEARGGTVGCLRLNDMKEYYV